MLEEKVKMKCELALDDGEDDDDDDQEVSSSSNRSKNMKDV